MTTGTETETDILEGAPTVLTLESGTQIEVERIRLRQTMRFLKILTVGAGAALAEVKLNADTEPAEMAQEIIALLLISIPDAEEESIDFIKSVVRPLGIIEKERTKDDRAKNIAKYEELYTELDNPSLEDSLTIFEAVVKVEAPHLVALGKRLALLLPNAVKQTSSSKKPSAK